MNRILIPLILLFTLSISSCKKSTCNNGILDGNETEVDCGGDCQLCDKTWEDHPFHDNAIGEWYLNESFSSDDLNAIAQYQIVYIVDSTRKLNLTDSLLDNGHYLKTGSAKINSGIIDSSYSAGSDWVDIDGFDIAHVNSNSLTLTPLNNTSKVWTIIKLSKTPTEVEDTVKLTWEFFLNTPISDPSYISITPRNNGNFIGDPVQLMPDVYYYTGTISASKQAIRSGAEYSISVQNTNWPPENYNGPSDEELNYQLTVRNTKGEIILDSQDQIVSIDESAPTGFFGLPVWVEYQNH